MAVEWTRVLATLLLIGLSLTVWKLLLQPSQQTQTHKAAGTSAAPPRAKAAKKKTKKRAGKKAAATTAQDAPASTSDASASAVSAAATATTVPDAAASESDDESDEDEGLSAAQILARRKFTTTRAIGGGKSRSTAAAQQQQLNAPKYELNQRVFARFQGGSEWFPATITEVRRGNEYHVTYDDGELEYHVPFKLIKPRSAPDAVAASADALEPQLTPSSPSAGANASEAPRDRAPSSSDVEDNDESDEDDGWSIVGASTTKRPKAKASGAPPVTTSDGLTKRQRESRRKRERQREIKELARAQAQENGLHAKWGGTYSKMKYVPPPPTQT